MCTLQRGCAILTHPLFLMTQRKKIFFFFAVIKKNLKFAPSSCSKQDDAYILEKRLSDALSLAHRNFANSKTQSRDKATVDAH